MALVVGVTGLAALLTLDVGCAGKTAGGPTPIYNETIDVGTASVQVELAHEARGARKVAITLKMRNLGVVDTEKLVADVHIVGFNIEEGSTHWDGFAPPRQPQTFTVLLSVPEGTETASATVSLLRSHDSMVLVREELDFKISDAGVITPAN